MTHVATFPEPPEVVAQANAHVLANPARVTQAVQRWLAKAAAWGIEPPALVPLRPMVVPQALLSTLAQDLQVLLSDVAAAVARDPAAAGLNPQQAREVGLLADLAEERFVAWSRPDGFWDGNQFFLTEFNVGNGAGVTAVETAWLNELYADMGLFTAVPQLIAQDPVAAWRASLDRRTHGDSAKALGVVLRAGVLHNAETRVFQGQMAAFVERLLAGSEVGGVLEPDDEAGMALIEEHGGVFFQYGTEGLVALRQGYQALRVPQRRARWWMPPTCSLLDKNVLPLACGLVRPGSMVRVPQTIWVEGNQALLVAQRGQWIVKSSTNEKGVLWDDVGDDAAYQDQLRLRGLRVPLVAQRRATTTRARLPVFDLKGPTPWTPREMDLWVENSPFLFDGEIAGVFGRCVPASVDRPVLSPPPPELGLCITVGCRPA